MVTFELENLRSEEIVEVVGTADELKVLAQIILDLVEGKDSHVHLMTEDWAGNELGNEVRNKSNRIVNQVNIVCLDNMD